MPLSLEPSRIDLNGFVSGDARIVAFTIRDAAGDIIDVSSGTVTLTARENADAAALFTITADVATSGASGIARVSFSTTDSAQSAGRVVYSLHLVLAGLAIDQSVAYGDIEFTPRIAA